ncbi:MAG: hypothetical protein WCF36_17420 [Candidatus Nanopelagicales bacterium]
MRRRHRIGGLLGSLALAGAAIIVVPAGPAAAAECPGSSGVTVIVDTGSSISTRCASGDPRSGLAALSSAGFSVTQVQTQPGFVCRIDGLPSKDPCRVTPPTSAYWSYWYAPKGGSWSYSSRGAGAHDPAPGSVEGWRFGSGQQPRVSPPATPKPPAPKPTPTKKPTKKPTAKPSPTKKPPATATKKPAPKPNQKPAATPKASTARSSTPSPAATTKPKAGSTATPTPARAPATATSSPSSAAAKARVAESSSAAPGAGSPSSAGPAAPPVASSPSAEDLELVAQPADAAAGGGNGPSTLIAGAILVALVALGAGFVARKRRV